MNRLNTFARSTLVSPLPILLAAGLPVLLLTPGCACKAEKLGAVAGEPREWISREIRRTVAVTPGVRIELENLAGRVSATAAPGNEFILIATVHAGGESKAEAEALAARLDFTTDPLPGVIRVKAGYPLAQYDSYYYPRWGGGDAAPKLIGVQINSDRSERRVCGLPLFGGCRTTSKFQGTQVTVSSEPRRGAAPLYADVVLQIPAGAAVELSTVLGALSADGLRGAIRLSTGSGDVRTAVNSGELNVESGSGDVAVDGQTGAVRIETGSGDVTTRRVQGGVRISTGSGDVSLEEVTGPAHEVETGSGEIRLRKVSGALKTSTGSGAVRGDELAPGEQLSADTGSGDIRLDGDLAAVRNFTISTGSGDVEVNMSRPPDAQLRVDTGSGEITVDLPGLADIVSNHGEYQARLGQGRGKMKIETSSGDVKLRQMAGAPAPPAMPSAVPEPGALPHPSSEASVPHAPKAPKPPKLPK